MLNSGMDFSLAPFDVIEFRAPAVYQQNVGTIDKSNGVIHGVVIPLP